MDIESLALAKKFTKETAEQFGAIKGAPCTVIGESKDSLGNTVITLQWTNDDGDKQTRDITITKGKDGTSITKMEIVDNHLIVTFTDSTTMDAGEIDAKGYLEKDLVATVDIGTVTSGKTYPKGTPFETILRDILIKEVPPSITLNLTPDKLLYDIISEEITTIKLTAVVRKGTYVPKVLKFFADGVEIKLQDIVDDGIFNFKYTPESPIKKNTVFEATVTDGKLTGKNTKTVKFVAKSYYGTVDASISQPKESEIKVLQNNVLKDTASLTYSGITMDYGKVVYAYPASFGSLTSIKDPVNNLNYFDSFAKTTVSVDGMDYFVYTQIDPSASENVKLTFA